MARPQPYGGRGLAAALKELLAEIRELYLADETPWVLGYSGGKDSTLTVQLVWMALAGLPVSQRTKTVHVISTDTLVENPVVAAWANRSLEAMSAAAAEQQLPIHPHRLTPELNDTFWVNLIGRGYAAPRPLFRWCTERLKIRPSNKFILDVASKHGEVILVLGIRKTESTARARTMERHEKGRIRDRLSPHGSLPGSLVYSPIETWTTDEVWGALMQHHNPWGHSNKDLLAIYRGASPDSECPLVVDTSTPSCGDSRMGCWTCTMVDQDKSLKAMVTNDEELEWMEPLLDLRDALDIEDDRHLRDFRRMNGQVQEHRGRLVHGPYTQAAREDWLRRLLEAQTWIRAHGPDYVRDIALITLDELHLIRRIWVFEKHEVEDNVPRIYEETTGELFPGKPLDETIQFSAAQAMIDVLRDFCGDDAEEFLRMRALLEVERTHNTMQRRAGLLGALEKVLLKHSFKDEDDALAFARFRRGENPDKGQDALF
ncbi:DNA phosphorothioation system sulfurtransferase DndC [Streptomyces scabiei]|uniref:DNA phosphorothioation system sulfurtransferase DndC n=1 Tax=Streptomyces scabiei TaxID=1930 RepID=UPI00298F87B3|nr:DNA phosphorothioation system sulfurtransferase DndC [Streptomyces scabiei]MDW8804343.1 DNA phosphorothioation system sulfurtransferase DndC [Streptomyces scabiei]